MAPVTKVVVTLILAIIFLTACGGNSGDTVGGEDQIAGAVDPANTIVPDANNNMGLVRTILDGQWLSNCVARDTFPQDDYLQESIVVDGNSYERIINYYVDSDCTEPSAF